MSVYPVEAAGNAAWGRATNSPRQALKIIQTLVRISLSCASNVACNISGMEYPGIVFWFNGKGAGLWGVTDPEFGHTWFPMVVGSNERRMDGWTGFNTFINGISADDFNNGEFRVRKLICIAGLLYARRFFRIHHEYLTRCVKGISVQPLCKTGYGLGFLRDQILGPERFD
jgi:hypothetical protein